MKGKRQVSIGVHEEKYKILTDRKQEVESTLGRHLDWGTFFMILAAVRSVEDLTRTSGGSIAEFHDSGDEEANAADFEEIPGWVTKEEVEELVTREADRIIGELK